MCAATATLPAGSQPSQKGKGKMPTIPPGSGSPRFPAHSAARPQPPGMRGRPAAAPRSSGCCSACGAEVGFIPCSPPAPRIWDQGAAAHSLHGPTTGLATRRGLSRFSPWKVPAGCPQILLSNWWHHVSVGDQVQGFKGYTEKGGIVLLLKTEGGKAIPLSLFLFSFQQPLNRLKKKLPADAVNFKLGI